MDIRELKSRIETISQHPRVTQGVLALISIGLLFSGFNIIQTLKPISLGTPAPFVLKDPIPIQQLQSFHILGTYPIDLNNLPLASLGITLQGIFLDNNGDSTAVIAGGDGSVKNYHAGDQLAPNVSIVKILPDGVVVNHNGKLEQLKMTIVGIDFGNSQVAGGLF